MSILVSKKMNLLIKAGSELIWLDWVREPKYKEILSIAHIKREKYADSGAIYFKVN